MMATGLLATGLLATGLLVIVGCGGLPGAAPPPDDMSAADDGGDADGTISYAGQVQPIFNRRCTVCHVRGGIADFSGIALRLTQEESFDLLINQPSVQNGDLTLVVPGDADASLLIDKISSNSPAVGSRMPLGGTPLTSDEIDLICSWIDQGAMNN